MMKLYLAHPITGLSGPQVFAYYDKMKEILGPYYEILSPVTGKDYLRNTDSCKAYGYKNELSNDHAIFQRDTFMVSQADVVFCDFVGSSKVSIGSCMELGIAAEKGKHTVLSMNSGNPHKHSFIIDAADIIYETQEEAVAYLICFAKSMLLTTHQDQSIKTSSPEKTIELKYSIGDVVYIVEKKDPGEEMFVVCPACFGKKHLLRIDPFVDTMPDRPITAERGMFQYFPCSTCNGSGVIPMNSLFKVEEYSIDRVKINVHENNSGTITRVRFVGKNKLGKKTSFSIEEVYTNVSDAQTECDILNKTNIRLFLGEIYISPDYDQTIPDPQKFAERIKEYKDNKRTIPSNKIVVDEKFTLLTGYTTYLIHKMFGDEAVEVVVELNKKDLVDYSKKHPEFPHYSCISPFADCEDPTDCENPFEAKTAENNALPSEEK